MTEVFNWIQSGYDLVNVKMVWNDHDFMSESKIGVFGSPCLSLSQDNAKWKLQPFYGKAQLSFYLYQLNSEEKSITIVEPVLISIYILNGKGEKILQRTMTSEPNSRSLQLNLSKEDLDQSKCPEADGSFTFCCEIFYHVKKEPIVSANPTSIAVNCSGELITQLEGLFEEMKFSDVIFNIGPRQFPAHKSILAARSEVFEAMFTHSTKEKLTNRIDIEDIEPEVFQELLHFIYTGRLSTTTMNTLAVGLLIAADKYLLIVLKNECENYLLRKMSPENCVELILRDDLFNPPENLEKVLKEAAKRFQLLPGDVMATAKWEKMEKENPQMLFKIQKILFSKNGVQKFV